MVYGLCVCDAHQHLPPYLCDVETKHEIDGKKVVKYINVDTPSLEALLEVFGKILVVPQSKSVEQTYDGVDERVEKQVLPDALVDAPLPEGEDPEEPKARVGGVLDIGDRHSKNL